MARAVIVAILLAIAGVRAPCLAAVPETAGVVRVSAGPATITRADRVFPAAVGTKLLAGDVLETGPGGSLGVILRDNSTLSLGPETSLSLSKFLFAPAQGRLGLLARLSKGTMAFVSGLIGKLAPESVRFETPAATIGIRGTRFALKAGGAEAAAAR